MKYKFILILIVGIFLRIAYWLYSAQYVTTDISYWGLMAKHIAEGSYFPVWRYGTETIGAFFSCITAVVIPILGVNIFSLSIVELMFSILFVVSTYFVGKALLGRTGGLISALLVSLAPFSLIKAATFPTGVYNIILFLGNILFLLSIKIRNGNVGNKNLYIYAIFGFIGGFLLWIHLYSICFLMPCFLFIMLGGRLRINYQTIGKGVIFLVSFLIGSFPFWWFNIENNLQTFHSVMLKGLVGYGVVDILSVQLNNMLDIKTIFSLSALLGFVYFVGFIYFCYRLNKKGFNSVNALILLFMVVVFVVISRIDIIPPMELHPAILLYAGFPYIVAYLAVGIIKRSRLLSFVFIAFIVVLQLVECELSAVNQRKENVSKYRAQNDLIPQLKLNNIGSIYTSENLMSVINFLTNEDIIVSSYDKFSRPVYPYYNRLAETAINTGVVLPLGDSEAFTNNLRYVCSSYKKEIFDQYILFYSFISPIVKRRSVPSIEWNAVANFNNKDTKLAFDRDVNTRWTTHQLQAPDMRFLLDLGEEIIIDRITVYLDGDISDRALGLKIEVSGDKENWEEVVYLENNKNILFWSGPHMFWKNYGDRQEYHFKPVSAHFVRLKQIGYHEQTHPYYWSIRELFVYSPVGEGGMLNYNIGNLCAYIEENEFNNIYTDYWLSANLEQDISHVCGKIDLSRDPVIIVDKNVDIEDDFDRYGISYSKEVMRDFYVFYSLRNKNVKLSPIDEQGWKGTSNCYPYETENAFDNDITTRWTSNKNQAPGFYFQVDLEEKKYISGVTLWHEGSSTDWPRGIRIEVLKEDSVWQAVEYNRDFSDSLYWSGFGILADSSKNMTYFFEPVNAKSIRLVLTGSSSGYWWSIHELDLLEAVVD